MEKEFSFNRSYTEYAKKYFKTYFVSLLLLIAVLIRIYFSDWLYKTEIFWGLIVGYPILLIISSIYHFQREAKIKYIFTDKAIVIVRNGNKKSFYLHEITDIIRPKKKYLERTGIDYIKIKFENGQKITFGNTKPYFSKLKPFLEEYLKEKLNYTIRQN